MNTTNERQDVPVWMKVIINTLIYGTVTGLKVVMIWFFGFAACMAMFPKTFTIHKYTLAEIAPQWTYPVSAWSLKHLDVWGMAPDGVMCGFFGLLMVGIYFCSYFIPDFINNTRYDRATKELHTKDYDTVIKKYYTVKEKKGYVTALVLLLPLIYCIQYYTTWDVPVTKEVLLRLAIVMAVSYFLIGRRVLQLIAPYQPEKAATLIIVSSIFLYTICNYLLYELLAVAIVAFVIISYITAPRRERDPDEEMRMLMAIYLMEHHL